MTLHSELRDTSAARAAATVPAGSLLAKQPNAAPPDWISPRHWLVLVGLLIAAACSGTRLLGRGGSATVDPRRSNT